MSFVATLTTDKGTTPSPTWADVKRAISALDAQTQTFVMLAPPAPGGAPVGDRHMAVGGGGDGRFIVYVTEDNLKFWNLIDPKRQGDRRGVRMLIGGQEGDYHEEQFVSRELALQAAHQYFEDGQRATFLSWAEG